MLTIMMGDALGVEIDEALVRIPPRLSLPPGGGILELFVSAKFASATNTIVINVAVRPALLRVPYYSPSTP